MPARDGTGPMSRGPATGRGLGPCKKGTGRGFGRRFTTQNSSDLSKEEQRNILEQQKRDIEKRLEELKE